MCLLFLKSMPIHSSNYEFIIYAGNLHCKNPMSYEVSLDGNFGTGNVAYYVGSNGLLEHESAH